MRNAGFAPALSPRRNFARAAAGEILHKSLDVAFRFPDIFRNDPCPFPAITQAPFMRFPLTPERPQCRIEAPPIDPWEPELSLELRPSLRGSTIRLRQSVAEAVAHSTGRRRAEPRRQV